MRGQPDLEVPIQEYVSTLVLRISAFTILESQFIRSYVLRAICCELQSVCRPMEGVLSWVTG